VQRKIVTLALNPTIDGSAVAEAIRPLHKIRTSNERYGPGGGGINVARTILALGGAATAVYVAGGITGRLLDGLLRRSGVPSRRVRINGTTRIAHTVLERSTGSEYRFVPDGPAISHPEWLACRKEIEQLAWDYLVASGSLPPGASADAYADLALVARKRGARLVLDTSGPALRAALDAGVYLVKPSLGELEDYMGQELPDEKSRRSAVDEIVRKGKAEVVALSLGQEGALLAAKDASLRLIPPPVEAKSAVGAGDSFVGAMALELARGQPLTRAFARGVAAGTAAVLAPGHEAARAADVDRLFALVAAAVPKGNTAP